MRELTNLNSHESALRLAAALDIRSIPTSVDYESGRWIVWVLNDDDRQTAAEVTSRFQENPDAEEFREAERLSEELARQQQPEIELEETDQFRRRWNGSWWHTHPATQILTVICIIVVSITTDWEAREPGFLGLPMTCDREDSALLDALYFQKPILGVDPDGNIGKGWEEADFPSLLQRGQVWRLVTPVFIHFGIVHILFNMLWLRAIGISVEFKIGTLRFLVLFLVLAVISNSAQFLWKGPAFGGMSGVVYGLIGYVWIKGITQPRLGLGLSPNQIVYAVLWLLLCMFGAFGDIANAAHVGGFVSGIIIGGRQALWSRMTQFLPGTVND